MKPHDVKVILVPGNGGATMEDHWFPYVSKHLTDAGFTVIAKNFPDPFLARKQYWLPFIENEIGVNENTLLIGHSSGAEAAMRVAERNKLLGSVLVSPCYTDMGIESETISGWYDDPWLWDKIKENQKWIIQFSSTDDPIVPIAEQLFVKEKLQPEYHEFSDRGHFNGYREFPKLTAAILENIQKVK